jgi:heme-degrading monooxygenase HmoA
MYARLTTIQGDPVNFEEAIRVIENDVIPASKVLSGFKSGYWLTDRVTGKLLALTIFETEEDIQASEASASHIRVAATEKLGSDIKKVERFEVVARA